MGQVITGTYINIKLSKSSLVHHNNFRSPFSLHTELATQGSSATSATDYLNLNGVPGEFVFGTDNDVVVPLTIYGDDDPEADEKFNLLIQSIGGVATAAANNALEIVTIIDDGKRL